MQTGGKNIKKLFIIVIIIVLLPSYNIKADENKPPTITNITGIDIGKINTFYNFTFYATDPEDDDLYYQIHWGDSIVFYWIGPYKSGEQITISYCFFLIPNTKYDEFIISARAKDTNNACGEWGHLKVVILKNKIISNNFDKFKSIYNWLYCEYNIKLFKSLNMYIYSHLEKIYEKNIGYYNNIYYIC